MIGDFLRSVLLSLFRRKPARRGKPFRRLLGQRLEHRWNMDGDDSIAVPLDSVDIPAEVVTIEEPVGSNDSEIDSPSPNYLITIDGVLPRRIVIRSMIGENLFDYYHYSETFDTSFLANGEYLIRDASSGESWRERLLLINEFGASLDEFDPGPPPFQILVTLPSSDQPQRVQIRNTSSEILFDEWVYGSVVDVTTIGVGTYNLSFATSGEVWRFMDLHISESSATLSDTIHRTITLDGLLPRRIIIRDAAQAVIFDAYHYDQVFDTAAIPIGEYDIEDAASGEAWRRRILIVESDASRLVEAVPVPSIEMQGVTPRQVLIRNLLGDVVLDGWHYDSKFELGHLPFGVYLFQHAASGEYPTLVQLVVSEDGVVATDVTPYRHFVSLEGDLPHRVQVSKSNGTVLSTIDHFNSLFNMDAYGYGEFIVRHWSDTSDVTVLDVALGENSTTFFERETVALTGSLPRHVEIRNAAGDVVETSWHTDSNVDIRDLSQGVFELRHWSNANDQRVWSITVSPAGVFVENVTPVHWNLHFEGPVPRLLRIEDTLGASLYDYWHYYDTIDLRFLPNGDYLVSHAASGESFARWQVHVSEDGLNVVDVTSTPRTIEISGIFPQYVQMFDTAGERLLASWYYGPTVDVSTLTSGSYRLVHAPSGAPLSTLIVEISESEVTTTDVTDVLRTNTVLGSNLGLGLRLLPENISTSEGQVEILSPPRYGSLVSSSSNTAFHTYRAATGFDGSDWFTYRYFDGQTWSGPRVQLVDIVPTTPESLSYFVPNHGTVAVSIGEPLATTLVGNPFPYDVIVASQYGPTIRRISALGNEVWRFQQPLEMRTVATIGDEVFVSTGNGIGILDAATGNLQDVRYLGDDTLYLHFINPIDQDQVLVVRETLEGLMLVELWSYDAGLLWRCSEELADPRWVDKLGDTVAIADTYNHRGLIIDIQTDETLASIPAYYVNAIKFVDADTVYITEEHFDRVWTLNWQTQQAAIVMAAPDREDLTLTLEERIAIAEDESARIDPSSSLSKSRCSTEFSGVYTLYSPNDADRLPDGSYFIADTDNHRVIHVSATGELLSEIYGFNNPTGIAVVLN